MVPEFEVPAAREASRLGIKRVMICAHNPGEAKALLPIATEFNQQGASLKLQLDGPAVDIFSSFINQAPSEKSPNQLVKWAIVSGVNQDIINTLQIAKKQNPGLNIAFIEQTEFHCLDAISILSQADCLPFLIITTSRISWLEAMRRHSDLVEQMVILPFGNPEHRESLSLDLVENRLKVRKEFGLKDSDKVITHIGRPDGQIYSVASNDIEARPVNSMVIAEVVNSLIELAKKRSEKDFVFINVPHPNEDSNLWDHPYLASKASKLPKNLKVISKSKGWWETINSSSLEICAASDLCTTIDSSLGLQIAILGSQPIEKAPFVPLVMQVIDSDKHMPYFEPDIRSTSSTLSRLVTMGVFQTDQLSADVEQALFNPDVNLAFREHQQIVLSHDFWTGFPTDYLMLQMEILHNYVDVFKGKSLDLLKGTSMFP